MIGLPHVCTRLLEAIMLDFLVVLAMEQLPTGRFVGKLLWAARFPKTSQVWIG